MTYWYLFLLVAFLGCCIASYKLWNAPYSGHNSGFGSGFGAIILALVAVGIAVVALASFIVSLLV